MNLIFSMVSYLITMYQVKIGNLLMLITAGVHPNKEYKSLQKFSEGGAWEASYNSFAKFYQTNTFIIFGLLLVGIAYIIFSAYRDWLTNEQFTLGDYAFLTLKVVILFCMVVYVFA